MHIYGPLGLAQWLRLTLSMSESHLSFDYQVHEIVPGHMTQEAIDQQHAINSNPTGLHQNEKFPEHIFADNQGHYLVHEDSQFLVTCASISHRIFCVGYCIQEKDQPGRLDAEALQRMGIPPGPLYGKIKQGQSVTLENGQVIHPADVVGPPKKGRKIVILGDTHDPSNISALACDCDLLVHETTFDDSRRERAIARGHSTPNMAGSFAHAIRAKRMIITHFSIKFMREPPLQQNNETEPSIHDATIASSDPEKVTAPEDEDDDDNSTTVFVTDLLQQTKTAFNSDLVEMADDFATFAIPRPSSQP